jgi:hypothetical protein
LPSPRRVKLSAEAKEQALDLWEAGMTARQIADGLGTRPIYVTTLVDYARKMQDPRAIRHNKRRQYVPPSWVPPDLCDAYVALAFTIGEEQTAAIMRRLKLMERP